jgi:hypothetical protein
MKWYFVKFDVFDLRANTDVRFINDFISLLHKVKHPDKLGLYKLKFEPEDGMAYYVSTPTEVSYQVKSVLSYFPSHEVTRPNIKVLELVLGKDGFLIDSEIIQ